jgi:hypothetical protein
MVQTRRVVVRSWLATFVAASLVIVAVVRQLELWLSVCRFLVTPFFSFSCQGFGTVQRGSVGRNLISSDPISD